MGTATVTREDAEAVLTLVAEYLGAVAFMGVPTCQDGRAVEAHLSVIHTDDGTECDNWLGAPVPTGEEAARSGAGPMLNMEWEPWHGGPRPSILLEGGPHDWPTECGPWLRDRLAAAGLPLHVEAITSYALGIYPA